MELELSNKPPVLMSEYNEDDYITLEIYNKQFIIHDISDFIDGLYSGGSSSIEIHKIHKVPEFVSLIKNGKITKIIEKELSREAKILKNYESNPKLYVFLMGLLIHWYKNRIFFTNDHHIPSFNDLVGYSEVKKKIQNIKNKKVVLFGPPGCGKKKLIDSFLFNGENSYVVDYNPYVGDPNEYIRLNAPYNKSEKREKLPFKSNMYKHSDYFKEPVILMNNLELNLGTLFYSSTKALKNPQNDSFQYIYVPHPNYEERIELFKKYILEFKLDFLGKYTPKIPMGNINFEKLAKKTKFYSCWEIEYMCYNAIIDYLYKWRKNKKLKLKTKDIESKLDGFECLDWFETQIWHSIGNPLRGEEKQIYLKDLDEYMEWKKTIKFKEE